MDQDWRVQFSAAMPPATDRLLMSADGATTLRSGNQAYRRFAHKYSEVGS
jgi:hypothetical protein